MTAMDGLLLRVVVNRDTVQYSKVCTVRTVQLYTFYLKRECTVYVHTYVLTYTSLTDCTNIVKKHITDCTNYQRDNQESDLI